MKSKKMMIALFVLIALIGTFCFLGFSSLQLEARPAAWGTWQRIEVPGGFIQGCW